MVAKLNGELQVLLDAYDKVMKEKNDAMAAAEKCQNKMDLATRLVSALGSELDRWSQSIIDLTEYLEVIIGDVLLASAFVSYVGPFNKSFRDKIINDFVNFFGKNGIPMSPTPNKQTHWLCLPTKPPLLDGITLVFHQIRYLNFCAIDSENILSL